MLKREIFIFLTALQFYTRIPVLKIKGFSEESLNKTTRYLPIIGVIVGCISAGVFILVKQIMPNQITVLISMIASILVTGAFHEDGFADFCDGFGGGNTKEKILAIMKDSRIGTYGTIGLIAILGLKYFCLLSIDPHVIALILICGHTYSRFFPVLFISTSSYSGDVKTSKIGSIGEKNSIVSLIFPVISCIILFSFFSIKETLCIIPVGFIVFIVFRLYIRKRIGGYTGDTLGALQQISEIVFYLMIIITKNIFN